MSDAAEPFDPAIGLLEFGSIAAGIVAADAMVKASPVASLHAGTIHPGRYLVLVGGDTAAVEIALESAGGDTVVDSLFLPDVHDAVVAAFTTTDLTAPVHGDAIGIVETATVAGVIVAADAGVKSADVALPTLRLGDDLGGKAYCLFAGSVADVEAAIDASELALEQRQAPIGTRVIPQLHPDMRHNLAGGLRFNERLRTGAN